MVLMFLLNESLEVSLEKLKRKYNVHKLENYSLIQEYLVKVFIVSTVKALDGLWNYNLIGMFLRTSMYFELWADGLSFIT